MKIFILLIILSTLGCNSENGLIKTEELKLNSIQSNINIAKSKKKSNKEIKQHLQEALSICNELSSSKKKIEKIFQISYVYYSLKDFISYREMNEKALKEAIYFKDSINIAKSYQNLGIYYRSSKLDIAYQKFYEAEKIYSTLNKEEYDTENLTFNHGKVLLDIARILQRTRHYIESEATTIKAIEHFHKAGNLKYLPISYTNLGFIARYFEQYDQAINYHREAIKFAKNTDKEISQTIHSYNNIGVIYITIKEYDKAKDYFNKALEFKEFLSLNPARYAGLLDNLGYANFLSNKMENIPEVFIKTLNIRDSIGDKKGIITNTLRLAEYYESINEDSIARKYAKRSETVSLELNNNQELLKSYLILSNINYNNEGLGYTDKYITLNDSLIREERVFRDKFARIRFETDQKEQQIIEVQNQNTIYLLGMLLLLSGIGFAIYFFRQRTQHLAQQNKMVQFQASYETETRISKRLHDELGNDIFQVMLQYQNDPHDPQIKEKLNTSYLKARDISRENNEFETDETFSEELNNMLHNYTQNGIQLMARGLDRIDWDHISKPIKITVYRVLQELMTNMQKHSKAKLVVLIFSNIDNILRIKYSDNGVGVTKEHLQSKNGLRNTEKRIQAIQGTLIFESEKDKGFKAEIKIPN
ncbi:tetratricopeptide repeat-containing sensor histidine kinase [Aquimarina aggregata]|uniref:tetratricopeptide repeat-containing sensor histidine kinase n=1 Tax=Aquimarina aggregata TaxID=1642818 RepID=UPI0012FD4BA9|nr:tetratricopeptide repeat-containing sensor histidine kinase [Aquimarina aggregata]